MAVSRNTGDVHLVWGKGFTARLISFLEWVVYGVVDAPTHVQMSSHDVLDISAEASGVKAVVWEETQAGCRKYLVARRKDIKLEDTRKFWAIQNQYYGRPYDFSWYVLSFMRLSLVFAPLVWFILLPLRRKLKENEAKHFFCSELVAQIYKEFDGNGFGLLDASNCTPIDILQVINSCPNWEIIEIGGTYE